VSASLARFRREEMLHCVHIASVAFTLTVSLYKCRVVSCLQFKDLSCVSCLLSVHTVLCSVSSTGVLAPEFQQVSNFSQRHVKSCGAICRMICKMPIGLHCSGNDVTNNTSGIAGLGTSK